MTHSIAIVYPSTSPINVTSEKGLLKCTFTSLSAILNDKLLCFFFFLSLVSSNNSKMVTQGYVLTWYSQHCFAFAINRAWHQNKCIVANCLKYVCTSSIKVGEKTSERTWVWFHGELVIRKCIQEASLEGDLDTLAEGAHLSLVYNHTITFLTN